MSNTQVSSFAQCISTCASTTGCVDVSLSGSACYLKSSVGANVYNGVWGAKLITSSSTTSTSTKATTTTAGKKFRNKAVVAAEATQSAASKRHLARHARAHHHDHV